MGKDLKGKELGKGICQRKDGLYFARCQVQGSTHSSYFKTAKEAKSWLKELDKKPKAKRGMTVDGEGSFTGCLVGCAKFTMDIMRRN